MAIFHWNYCFQLSLTAAHLEVAHMPAKFCVDKFVLIENGSDDNCVDNSGKIEQGLKALVVGMIVQSC